MNISEFTNGDCFDIGAQTFMSYGSQADLGDNNTMNDKVGSVYFNEQSGITAITLHEHGCDDDGTDTTITESTPDIPDISVRSPVGARGGRRGGGSAKFGEIITSITVSMSAQAAAQVEGSAVATAFDAAAAAALAAPATADEQAEADWYARVNSQRPT